MKRFLVAIAICCCTIGFTVGHVFAEPQVAAESVPAYVDPLANPAASVGTLEKLWRSGAVSATVILAVFMTLVALRMRVAWFSQGWRAVWCSAAIGGLSMLVDAIQSGLTPNVSMVVVTVVTTASLALQPKPKPPAQLPSGEVTS